ncbi:MAG TPA: hypothetical protein PLB70_06665 [Paludibacteraceae bacterium]|nr:hypothetical protein [Paludibacteraceae bacterium]
MEFPLIFRYSRADALNDGVLVDVSEAAREVGIRYPVAVTAKVFHEYLVPSEKMEGFGQSLSGRLHDLLWMFRCKALKTSSDLLYFEVLFLMPDGKIEQVKLKAICDGCDDGAPVITILMVDES